MSSKHLQKNDKSYKVFLYIFYLCGFIMASSLVYGVYVTTIEWMENGTYVMGEAIHNTTIPFENFARVSTWIFFSSIIGWYCCSRIGWKRTAGQKIIGTKMALLQLMLLGFVAITGFEVIYNVSIFIGQVSSETANGVLPDIDKLVIAYPDPDRPWNTIFAIKMFLASFIISAHAFYLSTKPRKSVNE
jgi:hypothetical protein